METSKHSRARRQNISPLLVWLAHQNGKHSVVTLKRVVQLAKQQKKRGAMEVKHLRRALIDYDPPPWFE